MQLNLFTKDRECAGEKAELPPSDGKQRVCLAVDPCPAMVEATTLAEEQDHILAALRSRTVDGFLQLAEPVLTRTETNALDVCKGLPWQSVHHVVAPVVERLTRRWAETQNWPPFAAVIEPAASIGPRGPRVMTLRLDRPSRGLDGTIAFQVHRRLHEVREPIPLSCLALLNKLHEHGSPFCSIAYLMPLWTGRGSKRVLLRSQADCRYARARALDPLIVGWLGDGPLSHLRLPAFVPHGLIRATVAMQPVVHHSLLFCIGHWD